MDGNDISHVFTLHLLIKWRKRGMVIKNEKSGRIL